MLYRFRLTAYCPSQSFLAIDAPEATVMLRDGREIRVAPRDADTLMGATHYHFEAGGFETEDEARKVGEHLRQSLYFLIALFGLTLQVPSTDTQGTSVSSAQKEEARAKGVELVDGRTGLSVLPDDGKTAEFVAKGHGVVAPSDPRYLLDSIDAVWGLDITLEDSSKRALELLSVASADRSPSLRFLTTYLALEMLVPRQPRSAAAVELLSELTKTVEASTLDEPEKRGLVSSLGHLRDKAFSATLREYASRISNPEAFGGIALSELVEASIGMRNRIAHRAGRSDERKAAALATALRQFALTVLWTRENLPPLSLTRPADTVRITDFTVRVV